MNLFRRILFAAVAIPALATSAVAEEITPQRALEKYAKSVEFIKTYDVTMTETVTAVMKSITEMRDGKRIGHYEPYPDGEVPFSRKLITRQVTQGNDTFRVEIFDPKTGDPQHTFVIHGVLMRWLDVLPGKNVGFIDKRTKQTDLTLMREGRHYGTFFVNADNSIPWLNVLGERKNLKHVTDDHAPELYIIESGAEPDTPMLPYLGVRIALDLRNGYLPAWIEQCSPKLERVSMRLEIVDRKRLPVGVAVPTKMKITNFDRSAHSPYVGKPVRIYDYDVDLEKSRWNCDLDEKVFTIDFPAGAAVFDQTAPRPNMPRVLRPLPVLPKETPSAQDVPN